MMKFFVYSTEKEAASQVGKFLLHEERLMTAAIAAEEKGGGLKLEVCVCTCSELL